MEQYLPTFLDFLPYAIFFPIISYSFGFLFYPFGSDTITNLFARIFFGLIGIVLFTSIYYAGIKTINIGILIIAVFVYLAYPNLRPSIKEYKKGLSSTTIKEIGLLSLFSVISYTFIYFVNQKVPNGVVYQDLIFYSNLSVDLTSGIETTEHLLNTKPSIYHYGDIWGNTFLNTIFSKNSYHLFTLVYIPFVITSTFINGLFIVRLINGTSKFVLTAFFSLTTFLIIRYILGVLFGFSFDLLFTAKLFQVFAIFSIIMWAHIEDKGYLIEYCLAGLFVLNIGAGIGLYIAYQLFYLKRIFKLNYYKSNSFYFNLTLLFFLGYLYLLTGQGHGLEQINSDGKGFDLLSLIKDTYYILFKSSWFYLLIVSHLFPLVVLFLIKKNWSIGNSFINDSKYVFITGVSILINSTLLFQTNLNVNSRQLFILPYGIITLFVSFILITYLLIVIIPKIKGVLLYFIVIPAVLSLTHFIRNERKQSTNLDLLETSKFYNYIANPSKIGIFRNESKMTNEPWDYGWSVQFPYRELVHKTSYYKGIWLNYDFHPKSVQSKYLINKIPFKKYSQLYADQTTAYTSFLNEMNIDKIIYENDADTSGFPAYLIQRKIKNNTNGDELWLLTK